jgi:hypothetical protein
LYPSIDQESILHLVLADGIYQQDHSNDVPMEFQHLVPDASMNLRPLTVTEALAVCRSNPKNTQLPGTEVLCGADLEARCAAAFVIGSHGPNGIQGIAFTDFICKFAAQFLTKFTVFDLSPIPEELKNCLNMKVPYLAAPLPAVPNNDHQNCLPASLSSFKGSL